MTQINRCICSINYYLLEKIVLTQLVNRSIVNNFRNTCARCVNDSDENRKKYKELHLSQHKAPLYLDQIEKITILSLTRDKIYVRMMVIYISDRVIAERGGR